MLWHHVGVGGFLYVTVSIRFAFFSVSLESIKKRRAFKQASKQISENLNHALLHASVYVNKPLPTTSLPLSLSFTIPVPCSPQAIRASHPLTQSGTRDTCTPLPYHTYLTCPWPLFGHQLKVLTDSPTPNASRNSINATPSSRLDTGSTHAYTSDLLIGRHSLKRQAGGVMRKADVIDSVWVHRSRWVAGGWRSGKGEVERRREGKARKGKERHVAKQFQRPGVRRRTNR
ncbi:hypothetical protein IWX48DRAFT_242797 [Phyllosticta citricarpa]